MQARIRSAVPEAVRQTRGVLEAKLSRVTRQLAGLNRELAAQMILLADQTGDSRPLVGAVQALRKVRDTYTYENAPRETAEVNASLGRALLALGRARDDVDALQSAVEAYRSAITLCSLIGDEVWKRTLRGEYADALDALRAREAYVPQTLSA